MLLKEKTNTIIGANQIIKALIEEGVDTIFGYPGGVVLELYDEIYKQNTIRHILVRQEQAAVHAASGYAQITKKCGVVLVTSGPGATNTITGIANAYLDGIPLILLTGQVSNKLIGKNAFQEADICDMVKSCTKKIYQIKTAEEIKRTIKEAFTIANTGKKGPVLIDLVKDIFSQEVKICKNETKTKESNDIKFISYNISSISDKIIGTQKPVIVAGGGVISSNAEKELNDFLTRTSIPVVNTMMGLGSVNQDIDNYIGNIGIFGDYGANKLLQDSDLIISLGARFNDRITCKFNKIDLDNKIIQIDINKGEIDNFIKPLDSACIDIKILLNLLNKNINRNYFEWLKKAKKYKLVNKQNKKVSNRLHSFEIMKIIEKYTKNKECIFTTEVGQHQLWTTQNISFSPQRRLLTSGGFGTMGYGLPASIGASIAAGNNKNIICITGDGSFQMNLQELATCVDNNSNIKIMLFNNGYLGMVRQLQEKNCNCRYSQTKISSPDYIKLAQSYGIEATRVSNDKEIIQALNKAFKTPKTFLIEFITEPMEML